MKKLSWISYDAVNSLVIILGAVYFTKWLIADAGVSDSVVAAVVSGASLLFIIVAPRFGSSLVDESTVFSRTVRNRSLGPAESSVDHI